MNKNHNNYFTTGEFAKICNVTKDTLFHYDKIGIFSPEIKENNKYRYYSTAQYDTFSVISILKELGMSLKEIKEYLNKKSPEEFICLMKKEEEIINKKIKQMQRIKKLIQHKSEITKKSLSTDIEDIVILDENEEYLITSFDSVLINENEKDSVISLSNLINLCYKNDIDSFYSIGGILDKNNICNNIYDMYDCYYIKINSKYTSIPFHLKKKGKYLTAYHRGSFYDADKTYKKILNYADKNKIFIKELFYEDILLDELSVKDAESYILKISIMVN